MSHGDQAPEVAPTPARRGQKFGLIEAGRGVAALLVVFHHAGNITAEPRFFGALPFGGHLANFNVGVDFFFVLSGFIIAWVHWGDLGHPDRIGSYAQKRFLRIFPPYWAILLPLILLYLAFPGAGKPSQHDPLNILLSIFLLPNTVQPVLGVAWTLTHELFFYALFALAIASGRRALWVFPVWAVAIVAANLGSPLAFPLSFVLSPFNLEFVMGIGAAYYLRTVDRVPAPGVLLAAGVIAFVLLLLFATNVQDVPLRGRIAFGTASVLFVLGAVGLERRRPIILPDSVLTLGVASYVIYLVHPVALSFGAQLLRHLPVTSLPLEVLTILLALIGTVAGLVFHWTIEPRATALARRLVSRGAGRFRTTAEPVVAEDR